MRVAQFKGKRFLSRAIRFLTRSPYSHSAFLFDDATEAAALAMINRGQSVGEITFVAAGSVIEAWTSGGVDSVPSISTQHTPGTPVDIFEFREPLTAGEEEVLLIWLRGEMGVPYGFRNVLRFVTKRPGNLDDTWFCSELVCAGAGQVKRTLFEQTQAWEVPPDWVPRSPLLRFVKTELTA